MTVHRAAGPAGKLSVTFDTEKSVADLGVLLDGKPFDLDWHRQIGTPKADDDPSVTFADRTAYEILRGIRNGKLLSFGAAGDTDAPAISLDGLAGVLLLMDDVQGRIGTETALARVGPAPAATVPPEPPLPASPKPPTAPAKLSDDKAKALVATIRASPSLMTPADCDADIADADDQAYPLTTDTALVLIDCLHGAYQSSSVAFLAPIDHSEKASRLTLAVPLEKDPVDYVTEGNYDPDTGTLTMAAKGRGLADCGMSATWVFDGARFQLTDLARQDRCGGEPGDWPTLWRSVGVPKQ
jgi:hypothetical protein